MISVFWISVIAITIVIGWLATIDPQRAHGMAEKLNPKIQLLNPVVSMCTIISIMIGVWSWSYDHESKKQREVENKKIIIENLAEETSINLDFIRAINEWDPRPDAAITGRFNYFYLDKIKDIDVSKDIRRLAIDITNDLQQGNVFVEYLRSPQGNTDDNQKNLVKFLEPTKPKLVRLQSELNKLSDSHN